MAQFLVEIRKVETVTELERAWHENVTPDGKGGYVDIGVEKEKSKAIYQQTITIDGEPPYEILSNIVKVVNGFKG